jgi:hypothetical protein
MKSADSGATAVYTVKVSFTFHPDSYVNTEPWMLPNTSVTNTDFKFTEVASEATQFNTADSAFTWARFVMVHTSVTAVSVLWMEPTV